MCVCACVCVGYYLEDCIQLTHFVPPSNDSKGEEGGDEDVRKPLHHVT